MRNPIKIIHAFSTFDLGGPQSRFVALHKIWGDKFRHIIVAMDGKYGAAKECDPRLCEFSNEQFWKSHGISNRRLIQSLIKSYQPNVIVSYNWGAIEWPLFASMKIPRIHVEEGFSVQEHSGQYARRIWLRRMVFVLRRPKVIVVSQNLARIAKEVWLVPPKMLHFIHNGVDLEQFTAVKANREQLLTIGTVCGLRPEKRVDRLLKAFAALDKSSLSLKIAGDGPLRSDLERLTVELGIKEQVEFLGHQTAPHIFYKNIDCFVLCSDTEQAPFALLEAMASGLPCIVTNVGDMPQMLPTENRGWICETSVESLVEKLAKVYLADLPKIGALNRNHAESNYSLHRMQEQWAELLASC